MIRITSLSRMHGIESLGPVSGRGSVMRPSTLLIVEDDAATRLALACMVADSDRQVVTADSAEEALAHLPLVNPDVILCDYMLGGMNGTQFCRALRRSPRWQQVPVIMVTQLDGPEVVAQLMDGGADDVLTKPVRGEDLRARVQLGLRLRAHSRVGQRWQAALRNLSPLA